MMAFGPTALTGSSRRLFQATMRPAELPSAPLAEQRVPGNTTGISYEYNDGRWHDELSDRHDRPITEVKVEEAEYCVAAGS